MRGAALTRTILTLVVWAQLPKPAFSTFSTSPTPLQSSPDAFLTVQNDAFSLRGPQLVREGDVSREAPRSHLDSSLAPRIVSKYGYKDDKTSTTSAATTSDDKNLHELRNTSAALFFSDLGGTTQPADGMPGEVMRRSSPPLLSVSSTAVASPSSGSATASAHRHRHHHATVPQWLRPHLDTHTTRRRIASRRFEEEIASVFRSVAYGGLASYRSVSLRRQDAQKIQGSPRIERTTGVGNDQLTDYLNDGGSSREDARENGSLVTPFLRDESGGNTEVGKKLEPLASEHPVAGNTTLPQKQEFQELPDHDSETSDLYKAPSVDLFNERPTDATERAKAISGVSSQWVAERTETSTAPVTTGNPAATSTTTATTTGSSTTTTSATPMSPQRHTARLSWLDVLRCTHRGLAWMLINFFLGLLLLLLSLLGPYRLLTMRCCTPLLPRTHYVAVHLLVFVATSLKAIYLFHLAFGSRGRLPLVLLLLLTNTGFPCLTSAFLVLMMMMFVAADVQVYKSKLCTAHNAFVFLVVMLVLAFVADVIVGCAHSRSVLVLSRVMVISVAVAAVLLFVRKQQSVLAVSQMMKREFQGELKLLVLPAKDDSLQRQMDLKHILRSRLGQWCCTVRVSAAALALLSLVHLLHTVFLVSAHVPAWAWWLFHVSGCLVEAVAALSTCVAAALTQRYDESVSFPYSFFLSAMITRGKAGTCSTHPAEAAAAGNAEAIYQRVSFSSGTESTHYTSCNPQAALACTPQAPRRRGAQVKRSATFSHAPHVPASPHGYETTANPLQVMRIGSASNLPLYSPASTRYVYGSRAAPRCPPYGPAGDASVLVHEDGFVRVRTPMDPREAAARPHGSLMVLQQANFCSSSPHLRGSVGPEAPPRTDSLYQSLSRRRKSSRGADVLQNNINVFETEYQSSPLSRQLYGRYSNLPPSHSPARDEAAYSSLSRSSGRGHQVEGNNYDYHSSLRRGSNNNPRDTHLNNLNHPENDRRSFAHRQVSREDNNDPVHHHHLHHDPSYQASRRSSRDAHAPPLNLYEEQAFLPRPSTFGSSSGLSHKVTNRSFSPSSPSTPPSEHSSRMAASPRTSRQARFPKPFVRVGSNMSLQGDDIYYHGDYLPQGKPVRRNHSSAGYYPSCYMAPSTSSLVETQRYGSLRLNKKRKRHPYLVSRYPDEWHKERKTRTPDDLHASRKVPAEGEEGGEEEGTAQPRECSSRPNTSSKRSDDDWAIELIKSSSMLTDFYSLTPDQKKAKRKEMEKEKEEILEEQEE